MGAKNLTSGMMIGPYQLKDEIGRGSHSIVYLTEKDGKEFALKISRKSEKNSKEIVNYRREAAIITQANYESLTHIYEVGMIDNYSYMVMEHINYPTLTTCFENEPMSETEAISFAIVLAKTLDHIHRRGRIHRDLQPGNIFWSKETKKLKLIDFGLAGDVGEEMANKTIGTIAYISPEQTGMLKRAIDGRSDLYSMGVILYECLSGSRPFQGKDILETISMHVKSPIPNIAAEVPGLSSEICAVIRKLLSKDPDDRYGSGLDLAFDLENIQNGKPLAKQSDKFSGQVEGAPFVGRSAERQQIGNAIRNSSYGQGNAVLICGEPGSGKSRLVLESVAYFKPEKSIVLQGKCVPGVTFAPFRQILEKYIERLSLLPETEKESLSVKLQRELPFLDRIAPNFSGSIGVHNPGRTPAKLQDVFFDIVAEGLVKLCDPDQTLIIVVDDIQWIDSSTRKVLARMFEKLKQLRIQLCLTARNDIENRETVEVFSREFSNQISQKISILPFTAEGSREFVESYLGNIPISDSFAMKAHEHSKGVPFALGEYVNHLVHNGVISPYWGSWAIDLPTLKKLDLPDNIVELVSRRIRALPADSQKLLSIAAVIGSPFHPDLLEQIGGYSKIDVTRILAEANLGNLIEAANDGKWKFSHDRIEQAFRQLLNKENKRKWNQLTAEILHAKSDKSDLDLLSIAMHFWHGEHQKNPQTTYESCCTAALIAVEHNDLLKGYDLFSKAEKLAGVYNISCETIQEEFGELCGRLGLKNESIQRLERAKKSSTSGLARARVHGKLSYTYVSNLETTEALNAIGLAFKELGMSTPSIFRHGLIGVVNLFVGLFYKLSGWRYGKAKGEEAERYETIVNLHSQMGLIKFFEIDPNTGLVAAMRVFNLANRLGDSQSLVNSMMLIAVFFGILKLRRVGIWFCDEARVIADKLGDPQLIAHVEAYRVFTISYAGAEVEAEYRALEVLEEYKDSLLAEDYVYLCGTYMSSLVLRGHTEKAHARALESIEHLESLSAGSDALKNHYLTWSYSYAMSTYTMMRNLSEANKYHDKLKSYFDAHSNDRYHLGIHLNNLIQMHLEQGEYSDRIEKEMKRHHSLGLFIPLTIMHIRHFFVGKAYLRLEQFRAAKGGESERKRHKMLKEALWQLLLSCDTSMFKSHYHVLKAHYWFETDRPSKVRKSIVKAEKFAFRTNNVTVLYNIVLLKARMSAASGNHDAAKELLDQALYFCQKYKWEGRKRELVKEFKLDLADSPGAASSISQHSSSQQSYSSSRHVSLQSMNLERNIQALIKVSTAASQTLDLQEQAKLSLDEILGILGAERALLFLGDHEKGELEFFSGRESSGTNIQELNTYSRTAVSKVWESQQPVVMSGVDEEVARSSSVVLYDLRSIIAAPVAVSGKILGVIYLDSRLTKGMFDSQDLIILNALSTQVAISIESAMSSKLQIAKAAMEKDFEVTGVVQSFFIPSQKDYQGTNFDLSISYHPASKAGGDWVWYDVDSVGTLTVVLGDVTGHGPGPAMITAMVAGTYQSCKEMNKEIPDFLRIINDNMHRFTSQKYMMTLTVIEFNPNNQKVFVHNAGGAINCRIDKKNQTLKPLVWPSSPIGIGELTIHSQVYELLGGQRYILATDGAYEFNYQGRQFGRKKLYNMFVKYASLNAAQARDSLIDELLEVSENKADDDIAFIIVDCK